MTDYVEQYRSLEAEASGHEKAAEAYRAKADEDRWEQCRIAHEAVESGGFSRRSFAKEVGKDPRTISVQFQMWDRWGGEALPHRPTYWAAQAEIMNFSTGKDRTRDIARAGVRNLPAEDKREVLKELTADPDLADTVVDIVSDSPRMTVQVNERSAEKRPAPPKKVDKPDGFDLILGLGAGATVLYDIEKHEEAISNLVSWVGNNHAPDDVVRAVVDDIANLKAAGDRLHMYAEELQVALDGGVSDERIAQFVEGL